jgi:hypothetical protein
MSGEVMRYELPRGLIVCARGLGEADRVGDALFFPDDSQVRLDGLAPVAKGRFMGPGLLAVSVDPEVDVDSPDLQWESVGQVRLGFMNKGTPTPYGAGLGFNDGTWVERGASVDNVEFLFLGPGTIVLVRNEPESAPGTLGPGEAASVRAPAGVRPLRPLRAAHRPMAPV